MTLKDASEFTSLLLSDTPLIDLRAPVEFDHGAFPGAVNLWLMDDAERAQVGTCYKRQGHDAAVALGHQLVSGNLRERRLAGWINQITKTPNALLYCFRGGQRSEIVQQWLAEAGFPVPRIAGGYKALRRHLLTSMDGLCQQQKVLTLGGLAGSGKTDMLTTMPASLDLEGLANHRGSAFGRRVAGQPAPINFEHRLIIRWMKLQQQGFTGIVTEDESRTIGRLAIPQPLWDTLSQSPIAVVEDDLESRVRRIIRDYVTINLADCMALDSTDGFRHFSQELLVSLERVKKRLGGVRYQQMRVAMEAALKLQQSSADSSGHAAWVEPLLVDYYDPMYSWQLQKKLSRVVFRGSAQAVAEYSQSVIR